MAKKSKSKRKKDNIPLEVEERILAMSPTDLTVECTFERNAIDALKKQASEHVDVVRLSEQKKALEEELDSTPEVAKAKEAYEAAKEEHTTSELVDVKADLAALKKGFATDIKDRSKVLKFMEKSLKRHIESGALKRKT